MSDLSWIPWGRGVRLLAEHPSGLLAVEKPEGILAHPNQGEAGERETTLIQGNYFPLPLSDV